MAMIVNENFRSFVPVGAWEKQNRAQFFSLDGEWDDSGESELMRLTTSQYMPSYKSDLIIYPPRRVQDEYLPLNDNTRLPFSHWKSGLPNEQEFYPFIIAPAIALGAGAVRSSFAKGKICKGQGLTGAEKRACKKAIKSVCGNKPLLRKDKKLAWEKCASSATVGESEVIDATKEEKTTTSKQGLTNNQKAGIAVGAVVGFGLLMLAVVSMTKKN